MFSRLIHEHKKLKLSFVINFSFIGIANALDLTDRVLPRLQLRTECKILLDTNTVRYKFLHYHECSFTRQQY